MHNNIHRFTGRAADYDRYRQRYPEAEILAHLRDWCGLKPTALIADIGAGTGMLAEVFLANGNRVLAVEPNPDMRGRMRTAVEQHLGIAGKLLAIIDATAEATTLADASVDIVAAGRAFHWFDQERALAEFRRILKPTGWVALVAAGRDRDAKDPRYKAQSVSYEHLMMEHGTDYTRVRSSYRSSDRANVDLFLGKEHHHAQIRGIRTLDWPAYLGHARSLSVSPPSGAAGHKAFERALRQHFDHYASNGTVTMPTICWINAGRLRHR